MPKSNRMKVLIVLVAVFLIATGIARIFSGSWHVVLSGNIAMCMMLCFTASGHFAFSKGMAMMIPSFIPFKKALVFWTGLLEIAAGIALLFPASRYAAGIFLILFFICILPANIHAALHHLDYQKGSYDGKGVRYLWFRIPMQLFLIAWVGYFSIYLP